MPRAVVTFLSDFGLLDEFVGVCHGVIATGAPDARIIDVTHQVPRQDVAVGAFLLRASLPYMPPGVHLAVVDPGVGTDARGGRRAVALATARDGRYLVGPDNGLLWPAAELFGGVAAAVDLAGSPARASQASPTFHGRDIFAPVAAALAGGTPLEALGEHVDPSGVARLELPAARVAQGAVHAQVVHVDVFGNLTTNASREQLEEVGVDDGDRVEIECDGSARDGHVDVTYGAVGDGELVAHVDSRGLVAVAVNHGSAAEALGASGGDALVLRPRPAR